MDNKWNLSDEELELIGEEVFEDCFMEDVMCLPDETREAYLESEEAAILEAKRLINGKTRIRMSKTDDLSRRTTLGAMHMAKRRDDPLFRKFMLHRTKSKLMKKKIVDKYGRKAERGARLSQKNYLKRAPMLSNLAKKFKK